MKKDKLTNLLNYPIQPGYELTLFTAQMIYFFHNEYISTRWSNKKQVPPEHDPFGDHSIFYFLVLIKTVSSLS